MPSLLRCFRYIFQAIVYLIIAWCCYFATVLLHEWVHGTVAWGLGFKTSPFAIEYGGTSWRNLLYLANINESVNYIGIGQAGHPLLAALISIAPLLLINAGLTLILGCYLYYHDFKHPISMWMTFCFLYGI